MTLDEYIAQHGTAEDLIELVCDFAPLLPKDIIAKLIPQVWLLKTGAYDFIVAQDGRELLLIRNHPRFKNTVYITSDLSGLSIYDAPYARFNTTQITKLPDWLGPHWSLTPTTELAPRETYMLIYDPEVSHDLR